MCKSLNWIEVLDIIGKIVTILAIIIGGVWTYFKYFKGRIFHPRLELNISGRLVKHGSGTHLILIYEAKNVGLSKIELNRNASGIRILKYKTHDNSLEIESADWKHTASFPVFEKHKWIESNEIIKESQLFSITEWDNIFYRADIRIVGKGKVWEDLTIISDIGE